MAGRRIVVTVKVEGAAKATRDLDQVKKKTGQFADAQQRLAGNFTTAVIAARVISGAYTNLKRALDFGVKSAISFEFSMKKVQAITATSGEELASLEGVVRDLAAVSPRTATEVADTALAMSKLGLSSKEVEDALEGVIGLSVALDENVEEVGSTLVSVKNVFQKEASDLTQISDQLFTSFANSALNLEKFSTAFSFAGGAAKLASVEFEELAALMAVLSDAGIRSSTIGTQLRSIFIEMSDSTSKFGEATGGLTIKEDGLVKVLKAAKVAIEGEGEAKRLFGKRAVSVIDILTRNIAKFEELRDVTMTADGATKEAAKTLSDSMAVALKEVSSAWTELNIQMSKIYGPALQGGLRLVSKLLRGIAEELNSIASGTRRQFGFTTEMLTAGKNVASQYKKAVEQINITREAEEALMRERTAAAGRSVGFSSDLQEVPFSMTAGAEAALATERADAPRRAAEALRVLSQRFSELKEDVALANVKLEPLGRTMSSVAAEARGMAGSFFDAGEIEKALEMATFAQKIEDELLKAKEKRFGKEEKQKFEQEKALYESLAKAATEMRKEEEEALEASIAQRQEAIELNMEQNRLLDEYNRKIIESSFAFQAVSDQINLLGSTLNTVAGTAVDALFQETIDWGQVFKSILKDVIKQLVATAIRVFVVNALLRSISGGGFLGLPFIGAPDLRPKFGPGFASGFDGVVSKPTPMIVGDAGPERVQITPAAKTARREDKGGLTVVIQGDVYGEEKFMEAVNVAQQNIDRNYVGV